MNVCGSCCLLRHVEGRYQKQKPDEASETFDRVTQLGPAVTGEKELSEVKLADAERELVLIAPFDGIGGARRALELLGILYQYRDG